MANETMTKQEVLSVLMAEHNYWKKHDDNEALAQIAMGAMGSLANVIAAIGTGMWMETQLEGAHGANSVKDLEVKGLRITPSSERASQSPSP